MQFFGFVDLVAAFKYIIVLVAELIRLKKCKLLFLEWVPLSQKV